MKLSYEMSFLLDETLTKIGKSRNISIMSPQFCYFSKTQLDSIEYLEINNMSNVSELIFLKNLKSLVIASADYSKMMNNEPLKYNMYINHIKDFSVISKLSNLEELYILHDINLVELDIESLSKLKHLRLIDNPGFERLNGLDSLTNLQEVIIYGNNIQTSIDINKYIDNTISTSPNILDIKMYNNIVNGNVHMAKALSDSFILGLTFLKFAEKNGFVDLTILDNRNLAEMFMKLNQFFERNKIYERTEFEKVLFAFSYVTRNIRFAEDELRRRMNKYYEIILEERQIPKYMEKNFASLHSSYNAYHFKLANCEGVVNLMAFMLDMLNIENINVHCSDKKYGIFNGTNHSMLRVKIEGHWYYCDPTYDPKKPMEYFMLTKEEILKTHNISSYENELVEDKTDGKINRENIKRRK